MLRSLAVLLVLIGASSTAIAADDVAAASSRSESDLPVWSTTQARKDRYVAAHGLRAFAGGYSEDGLEFWTFPLQIASGYTLDFIQPGAEPVPGITLLSSVEVDPLGVTRIYTGPDFQVRERIATQAREPGVWVQFQILEGSGDLRIRANFRPSLNLMWPAAVGGQEIAWDEGAKGFLLSEPGKRFKALVSSPQASDHTQPDNDRRDSEFGRPVFLQLEPYPCVVGHCASLIFAGQSEKNEDIHATTAALLRSAGIADEEGAKRFDFSQRMKITTPDADTNRALRWAQIALEQAWTCNARLGCGLVAGYGPSHGARRPQYAWYFAGDGLVATRALVHEGQYRRAAEELDFILRYQHPDNGMLWHEMSQSAGFVDWAKDYDYMYVHVDIAFQFLEVLAEYDRASGDDAFLHEHWSKVQKAYQYCLSTLDAGDGLPRVPHDKMSGNEQDRLTDELTLSAAWADAASAMSGLAEAMGDAKLAAQAKTAAERARASIRTRYRDTEAGRWISGFHRSGEPGESFSRADLAAIASGVATPEEAAAAFDHLASPEYLTAWGLRSKPTSAKDYDPEAYSRGSVWGLGSAAASERMWRSGRADQAAALWQRLVPWAAQDALGHMHEVQSGTAFTPQRESVPEQTWSSAGFLSAAIAGMLGLEADARHNVLRFAPQPPQAWRSVKVENVRVGKSVVDLEWRSEGGKASLDVRNTGPAFRLMWSQDAADGESGGRVIPSGRTRLSSP